MMKFTSIAILIGLILIPAGFLRAEDVAANDDVTTIVEETVVVEETASPADVESSTDASTEVESTTDESTESSKAEEPEPKKLGAKNLSTGGWIMMLSSVTIVTVMLIWCIYKVLATPESTKHLHTQADIEPPDVHDED